MERHSGVIVPDTVHATVAAITVDESVAMASGRIKAQRSSRVAIQMLPPLPGIVSDSVSHRHDQSGLAIDGVPAQMAGSLVAAIAVQIHPAESRLRDDAIRRIKPRQDRNRPVLIQVWSTLPLTPVKIDHLF